MKIFEPILHWQLTQVSVKIDQYKIGLIEKHLKPKLAIRLNRLQIENKYLHKLYEQAESIILNHNLK